MAKQRTSVRNITQTDDVAFELLRREAKAKPNENVAICGIGVSNVMGMIFNGARGKTADGLKKALYLSGSRAEINNGYAGLHAALNAGDLGVALKVANALYANQDVEFRAAFLERCRTNFGASVRTRDFSDPGVLNRESDNDEERGINPWCNAYTDGRIPTILKELSPDAILVALSALSFQGDWTSAFPLENTSLSKFKTPEGAADHELMFQHGNFLRAQTGEFDMLALPFGTKKRVAKYALLPKEGKNTDDVLATLTRASFWKLTKGHATSGAIYFPRYRAANEAELGDHLKAMGADLAFGGGSFADMADGDIKVSRVVQKNVATFDELGGRIDSVTAGVMTRESVQMPWELRFDRPFVSVVADSSSGALILASVVNKPERAPQPTAKQ